MTGRKKLGCDIGYYVKHDMEYGSKAVITVLDTLLNKL